MESRSSGLRSPSGGIAQETANLRGTVVAWTALQQRSIRGAGPDLPADKAPTLVPLTPHPRILPQRLPAPADSIAADAGFDNHDAGRCDMLIAMAAEQSRDARFEDAERSAHEAALLAERIGDGVRLGRAVIAIPGWNLATPEAANPLVQLLAERALALGGLEPGLEAMLTARLAAEIFSYPGHTYPGHKRRSLKLDESALRAALAAGDPRVELYVRCCRDRLLRQLESMTDRLSNAEEILRLALKSGDYVACHLGAAAKSAALAGLGRVPEAHQIARLADGIARVSQIPVHASSSLTYQTACAVMRGRFTEAREAFTRCRNLAGTAIPHLLDSCWPVMLAPLDENGQLSEIESVAEETARRRAGIPVYEALLSWIQVRTGRPHDASFHLQRFAGDRFVGVSKSEAALVTLAALAEVCVELKHAEYAALLYQRMAPYAGLVTGIGAVAIFGSVELHLGRLAQLCGKSDAAIEHFQRAIAMNRAVEARPWTAYSGYELARALSIRGPASDRIHARELIAIVEGEAGALNMTRLASSAKELRERLGSADLSQPVSQAAGVSSPEPRADADAARPTSTGAVARASDQTSDSSPASAPARAQSDGPQIANFRREGEYWLVGFQSHTFPLKHRTGLALIRDLLRHPGREICATDLGAGAERQAGSSADGRRESGSNPLLDATAKQSYREQLKQLREELERAHEFNDFERAGLLEQEIEFITRELARALGLAGRDRTFGSEAERARKRVSLAIKEAIRVIASHDPVLGRHLMRSVQTGRFCGYTPDPEKPVQWQV